MEKPKISIRPVGDDNHFSIMRNNITYKINRIEHGQETRMASEFYYGLNAICNRREFIKNKGEK